MDRKSLGALIKEQRLKKGLTQAELAKKIGLTNSQEIAAFESGSIYINARHVSKLSQALNISKEKFIQAWSKEKESVYRNQVEEK